MKAWVYYNKRNIKLEEVPDPVLKDEEVLIKVTASGICQTDIDEFMAGPKLFRPVPLIPGHEFGGKIVEVGNNVSSELINKTVIVSPLVNCKKCKYCKNEKPNLCEDIGYYGIIKYSGGFAEYAVVNKENIIEISDPEIVHFGEIFLIALRIKNLAENYAYLDKKVLISGGGPVGLTTALVLKHYGWEVEICEIRSRRREIAEKLGIKTYSIINEVPESNYSVVVDCAGEDPVIPYIFPDQISKVIKGGAIILVGVYFSEVNFNALEILLNEINIIPSFAYTQKEIKELPSLIQLFSDYIKQVTTPINLEDLADAFLEIEINKDNFIKVAIKNADYRV
jgi:(R,R)-butanediol dehydrogenase/meso-butanediol dehydrogenase/diacetyl reductase